MGRTLPTQIQILRSEEDAWRAYRRALRVEDQAAFDLMWSYARRHAMAASMANRAIPFEAHLISMLVGIRRELMRLETQIKNLG